MNVKYVARPIQAEGHTGRGRDAMLLLKHKILKSLLLRRTKQGRSADLALPPKMVPFIISYSARHQERIFTSICHAIYIILCQIFLRRDSLDIKEDDYLKSLYNDSRAQYNT